MPSVASSTRTYFIGGLLYFQIAREGSFPLGLKPSCQGLLSARLKPCPDTKQDTNLLIRCSCRLGGGRFWPVRDFHILEPILIRLDDHVGSDGVAGLKLVERRGRFDDVGHGHRVHEAGGGLVVVVAGAG